MGPNGLGPNGLGPNGLGPNGLGLDPGAEMDEPTKKTTDGPGSGPGSRPATGRPVRAMGLLLTLALLALPMLVVSQLMTMPGTGEVVSGNQPGGLLEGRVRDPEGEPLEGHEVILMLLPIQGEPNQAATTLTDADGGFSFQAPPIEGKYRLIAGGGLLRRTYSDITMVDDEGSPLTLEPVDLDLEPGAVLRIVIQREDGRPVTGGTLILQGTTTGEGLFDLVSYGIRLEREFEGDTCEVGGLPPMEGDLTVQLRSGDVVGDEITLLAGTTTRTYRL